MNKETILHLIVETLSRDLVVLSQAAKAAHEASIHEENIPDNKYETLGLEASYIAQAQANRAQEIRCALESYRKLALRNFSEGDPIRLTALVTLENEDGGRTTAFMGPEAGGLKVREGGKDVIVITPESPLGRALIGKSEGDAADCVIGGVRKEYEIVEVR